MLEGTVARILNQLLGKYVQDLDTENLNVGIFSGTVELSDLKLKPEALYELGLPIEVKAGTVGKISLQIPWTALWDQSVILNVEDIHIIVNPIIRNEEFDAEKNKRLLRAFKRRIIELLEYEKGILGGPFSFSEHLITYILNYIHINIGNIHIRYEDDVSSISPIAGGLCIGSITADSTNSKWRKTSTDSNNEKSYYLIKIEAISCYWNTDVKLKEWKLPFEYYQWRNSMMNSLKNYSYEGENFKFVLNPMMTKIKVTISKSISDGYIENFNTDVIVQDCNIQITKLQYDSIIAVIDNMQRMLIAWQFLAERPQEKILGNQKIWWKYAYFATLEQRIRPLTWSRIKKIRAQYKEYIDTYKQIINNPNDTELKLDLQQHEDNLSIINIVIARQHTRLSMQAKSQSEKSFWNLLPSPEKIVLCEKIGFHNDAKKPQIIDHTFNFKLGNLNVALLDQTKEILIATLTQILATFKPNFADKTFKSSLKIEGIILEAFGNDNALTTILSSEHLENSPAFFFTSSWEKFKSDSGLFTHRLHIILNSIECFYNKKNVEEFESFLQADKTIEKINLLRNLNAFPKKLFKLAKKLLADKWELNLNIKCPYFVIPEASSGVARLENMLVIDLGKFWIRTEICQQTEISSDTATKMEMEELFYSKLHIDCTNVQILFCDKNDDWKEARNEKDTNMHIIPKTSFTAVYAIAAFDLASIPELKFNILLNTLKLNISERKILLLLKFFNIDQIRINLITEAMQPDIYKRDKITEQFDKKSLKRIQMSIKLSKKLLGYKKLKALNGIGKMLSEKKSFEEFIAKNNMNEVWAKTVDLPGLEDNISPSNTIQEIFGFIINEFTIIFSKSNDCTDRQYLMLRIGQFSMDIAFMNFGPAYQISVRSILLTDKLHTTSSGQYLDLIFTPLPNNLDVITVLYRKVSAKCPDFWTHFFGVETSLVANFGSLHILLHQEAIHTLVKYSKYFVNKVQQQTSQYLKGFLSQNIKKLHNVLHKPSAVPVPPGSVKFSHSARMSDLNIVVCDFDFDIINIQLAGLEMDFLFRANERFVFRSYLGNINVDHLSQLTLYSKVLYTDEDKVFEIKYIRNALHIQNTEVIDKKQQKDHLDGSFKFHLGRIHFIFLYKLMVQLQRFVINLEILDYLEKYMNLIRQTFKTATDTLKDNKRISLAINICGPVILIPQKSSSPNVLVIDTGNLRIENFFKETDQGIIENILVKLKECIITRGVMSLNATLELQENLVEKTHFNMDVKKSINSRTLHKTWEIDSILEKIEITLGQKDLAMIIAIYTDNIGEANIVDLLPEQIKSPISEIFEQEDSVRELEAFFCEAKQKFIGARCKIEEIKIILFFDSNELLSSPIRDLNHGLCKLEINEVDCSLIIYSDKSSDGKLSIDTILVEEIGPHANVHSKIVLSSPAEECRNNNICNITVNKPPIVDVNFHQNKTGDCSIDIIVGRLCLSLSVPFCEKVALFVLECLPKDLHDLGIVNAAYEADLKNSENNSKNSNSLTISLRVNKPELMFLIETTSNKKRYFLTKSEILVDFSRHCNRLNLVTSFSGFHSIFYDLSEYSDHPYVVIKQCDIELSRNVEENNEKIIFNISGIYIKLCTEVIHSINDILNDIVEHFKLPEIEFDKRLMNNRKFSIFRKENNGAHMEELWEPKKMEPYINKTNETDNGSMVPIHLKNQHFAVPKFEIVVIFELEQIQVLLVKSSLEGTIQDWNSLLYSTGSISLQANYFNEGSQCWEPVIDPILVEEKDFRPWECNLTIFQDKSQSLNDCKENKPNAKKSAPNNSQLKTGKFSRSYTTTESEDSGEDMLYLDPVNTLNNISVNRRVKTSLSTFLDDSDSENEDGAMEKLAAAISDLFTGDWNEHEDSECEYSSDEELSEATKFSKETAQQDSAAFKKCTYIMINSKDVLNFTLTPTFLKIFNELIAQYSSKIVYVKLDRKAITINNDITPQSRVELYEKIDSEQDILIRVKKFENEESPPNSPSIIRPENATFIQDDDDETSRHLELELKPDYEQSYDFSTIRSLNFPKEITSSLYDKINKHYLKIFVTNFLPIQTNCSKKNWQKLVKLQQNNSTNVHSSLATYYLGVQNKIGKHGREIIVGSPLQIKNETCFALNILYQPSVLQQMNIEPVGDVNNPFETTMRIAILGSHETYNVPLYIAYHCKLFIQPAYAEGHKASESGIWWQDMAHEMDASFNLICKPKNELNPELFALRVILQKNLKVNSIAHGVPNYLIRLLPPLNIQNVLPYTLEVENLTLKQINKAEPGEKCSIYSLDLSIDQKLAIKLIYNSLTWSGRLNVTGHLDDKIILMVSDQKSERNDVYINVKYHKEEGFLLIFYSSYWIVNKTGLPLKMRASYSQGIQECPNDDILLFSYKRHSKQTMNIKVYDSLWSSDFCADCAGTTGLIVCKDNERKKKYLFFMNSNASNFCPRLTKIVKILPSFLVTNNTEKRLRFMENNEKTDLWIDLDPDQTVYYWPDTGSMEIFVKYRESNLISQPIFISRNHKTVLRMEKGTALTAETFGGSSESFRIIFSDYQPGDCPVLIKNYCTDIYLKIQQKDQSQVNLLNPGHRLLYTWDNPVLSRTLTWNVYNNKCAGHNLDIYKDGYGEEKIKFKSVTPNTSVQESSSSEDSDSSAGSTLNKLNKKVRKSKIIIYWACFVQSSQRILLFTQEQRIFKNIIAKRFHEHCYLEVLVSISGIGLSLFTSDNDKKEHIYASFYDSPATWEVNVGHKWKTLTLELASWIEDKYRRLTNNKKCQIKDFVHIDFEKMFMLKPFFAEIRRTYTPAIYCQLRKSANFQYLDLRLNYLQIDNKHSQCIIFQPIFQRNELSKSKEIPLFRIEILRQTEQDFHSFRFIKVEIADISLNIENDLWTKIAIFLIENKKFGKDYSSSSAFVLDINSVRKALITKINNDFPIPIKSRIEHMHISSFGILLTTSNRIQINLLSDTMSINRMLNYLFPHNMTPYMPLEGVHHKIYAAEWEDLQTNFFTGINFLVEHFTSRFLQQYYSQVLGLQVLVNNFDRQSGVEAISFGDSLNSTSSGIFYGFQCLLGHIAMSSAALETYIISVFPNYNLENSHQGKGARKRGSITPNLNDEFLPKIIANSSKRFEIGVPIVLAQLFVKNFNVNIQCNGEMFFKTSGKALFSLLAKHPDQKSDCIELAKEALRRALILGEPIRIHQRLTRYRHILGLHPFSIYESMGQFLLETIGNCRFANDHYWTHVVIDAVEKSIIIVSLEHVIRINKFSLWGTWEIEWYVDLDDIVSLPKMNCIELILKMRQIENLKCEQQIKILGPKEILLWLHEKIEQAIILSMEDKSWTVSE